VGISLEGRRPAQTSHPITTTSSDVVAPLGSSGGRRLSRPFPTEPQSARDRRWNVNTGKIGPGSEDGPTMIGGIRHGRADTRLHTRGTGLFQGVAIEDGRSWPGRTKCGPASTLLRSREHGGTASSMSRSPPREHPDRLQAGNSVLCLHSLNELDPALTRHEMKASGPCRPPRVVVAGGLASQSTPSQDRGRQEESASTAADATAPTATPS